MNLVKKDKLKILVISSCSGEKRFTPSNLAITRDLDNLELRAKKEKELSVYKVPANQMFISHQNLLILEAINNSKRNPNIKIDLAFISSGYGYIKATDPVIPYDINFSAMSMNDLDERSELLKIHEEAFYAIKKYDLVFFLLGYEYLRSLKLPLDLDNNIKQIFLISHSDEKILPENQEHLFVLKTGNDEAAKFKIKPSELKGYIFKILCQASENSDIFEEIYKNTNYLTTFLSNYSTEVEQKFDQMTLFDL